MARSALRQADLERLMKAAAKTDSFLRVDMKTLVVTVLPLTEMTASERLLANGGVARGGKENWDDIPTAKLPDDFAL